MSENDWLLGKRSLDLARDGFQRSSTRPLVGYVIADNDKILEEGWLNLRLSYETQLNNLLSKVPASNATLFINTNPLGTSEALTHLATKYSIQQVKVAGDLNNLLLRKEKWINRRFYTFHQTKRPYIILKWAQTTNGFVARSNYDSKWISGVHARKLVHQWRSQEAAIWVGNNTYRYDNPQLNVRDWTGEDPLRIVVDPDRRLDEQLNVFDCSQPTLYYSDYPRASLPKLESALLPTNTDWQQRISFVLADLFKRQVASVFIEGGATFFAFLIEQGWWDEARVFTSPVLFEEGISAPVIDEQYQILTRKISEDQLTIFYQPTLETEQKVKK